jgi:hypothetical protein
MAKDIAQQIQSWLPSTTATDPTSQQRILELETELAKVKTTQGILLPLRPTGHFEHSRDDSYSTSTTRTLSFHIYV